MVLCEDCKTKIQEKKGKKIEEEGDGTAITFLLLAGAGLGGYLLWKKAQPTTAMQSPILSIPQPMTKKEEENMIQVD